LIRHCDVPTNIQQLVVNDKMILIGTQHSDVKTLKTPTSNFNTLSNLLI
jgi:hypothetical protein